VPKAPRSHPRASGSRWSLPSVLARVVAAPCVAQLLEAAPPCPVPLFSPAFFGLPGLPPLPALAVALGAAVRHGALRSGRSASAHPGGRGPVSVPFTAFTTFTTFL
jgi:hypothetical protein